MASPRPVSMGTLSGKDTGPHYHFLSVASQIKGTPTDQNVVDLYGEYWIPYATNLIQPGQTPTIGKTFAECIVQDRVQSVIAQKLKDFLLFDVHDAGGQNFLVFARDIQPSDDLIPSSEWPNKETWTWPAVLRSWDVRFVTNSGKLIDIVVTKDLVERQQLWSIVNYKQFWTTRPWTEDELLTVQAQPSLFEWNYPANIGSAKGQIECLRPHKIQVKPFPVGLTGYGNTTFQGIEYDKTNVGSWVPDVKYDKQDQIRGRWFRELAVVDPPYSPIKYPKPPRVYAS